MLRRTSVSVKHRSGEEHTSQQKYAMQNEYKKLAKQKRKTLQFSMLFQTCNFHPSWFHFWIVAFPRATKQCVLFTIVAFPITFTVIAEIGVCNSISFYFVRSAIGTQFSSIWNHARIPVHVTHRPRSTKTYSLPKSANARVWNFYAYGNFCNGVYSLKWRLTERYPRWGTLADPRLGRAAADQCKSSEFLQELRISGFLRFGVSPTCFRAK